jgi:hypothetical protein
MASAKATLSQVFSWRPLGQRQLSITRQRQLVEDAADVARSSVPAERSHRSERDDAVAVPDLRQCEPWRMASLRDAATRSDNARIDRLSR